jgi:hypothetical protein
MRSSDISSVISKFEDLGVATPTRSVSDFSDLGSRTPTRSVSEFSYIHTSTCAEADSDEGSNAYHEDENHSEFELVSRNVSPASSPKSKNTANKPAADTTSENRAPLANITSGETLSARDQATWKAINEQAGGSIKRYHELAIEKANSGPRGVILPPGTAIPEKGELIGDQIPGYEKMTVGQKILSWWTKKQRMIFDNIVAQEVSGRS